MNNRMWSVALEEIRQSLARRSFVVMTFVLPILAVALVGGISLYRSARPDEAPETDMEALAQPVGYVDHSGLLGEPGPFSESLIRYESEAQARAAIEAGEVQAYYVTPADYLQTGKVTRYAEQINIASDMTLFEAFLRSSLLADEEMAVAMRVQSPALVVQNQVGARGAEATTRQSSGQDLFWLAYVFGLLMMLTTFLTSGQLMGSVIREKENRVMEIVLSSLRPLQLMAGKLVGQGLMGFLQLAVWLAAVVMVIRLADVNIGFLRFLGAAQISPALMIAAPLYFVLGFALFGAFAAGVGAISANMREGPQYAMVYSLPAAASMIFLPMIAETPNSALALGLSLFPMTAPIAMIERMVVTAVPTWQLALSLALVAASVVGALWLAGRLFRANSLLSGEVPGRKELVQILARG